MIHEDYMRKALAEAEKCFLTGDVPVGCVIVREGQIIARGHNSREADGDATAHAEVQAIREASKLLGNWRLSDCALYVTLEPCPMCAGAILNARVGTVVYGAREPESGACGSVFDLFMEYGGFSPRIYGGILSEECTDILERFFRKIRGKTTE